jgi:hypothetical protein
MPIASLPAGHIETKPCSLPVASSLTATGGAQCTPLSANA